MSPEPVAPSPEIEKAVEEMAHTLGASVPSTFQRYIVEVASPILTRLYLAAKIARDEELMEWLEHGRDCHYDLPPSKTFLCACGLSAALAKLREEAK